MADIVVKIAGAEKRVPAGTALSGLLEKYKDTGRGPIVAAKVDNDLHDLNHALQNDCRVQWIDLAHPDGTRIYARSLSFVMIRATHELFPDAKVSIEHSLCKGLYGEIHLGRELTPGDLTAIRERMAAIIARDEPIEKSERPLAEAVKLFAADGQDDKVRLFKYRQNQAVKVYRCGDFHDYFYGYTVPSTGYLRVFGLVPYPPGFVLQFPLPESPAALPVFEDQPKLARIYSEFEHWGEILDIDFVGALNDQVAGGGGPDLIRVSEALHEKKIAQIADMIQCNRERVRIILMAGPSSSGKTTFAQRLSIQLRVLGLKPVAISLDDYFVSRDKTPVDKEGKPDFEALRAIDLDYFNEQLLQLIAGKEVEVPRYDFVKGARAQEGRRLTLAPESGLILIEGIHGLNEDLTSAIPREQKFKIYVSALTQLNLDHHNRIPTTDCRIIRRIVRDSQFRSHTAAQTISQWPSVRRGEDRNIFPFQEEADVMFNSALPYELAILKKYAEPLLQVIGPDAEEFSEAKRLLKFLSYFLPLAENDIPQNSILREFIGEGCFYR